VPLECEASRLYAIEPGINAAHKTQVRAISYALGDSALVLVRAKMYRTARRAMVVYREYAEYNESGGLRGTDGEADATAENGTIRVTCPRCDQQHEIPQD